MSRSCPPLAELWPWTALRSSDQTQKLKKYTHKMKKYFQLSVFSWVLYCRISRPLYKALCSASLGPIYSLCSQEIKTICAYIIKWKTLTVCCIASMLFQVLLNPTPIAHATTCTLQQTVPTPQDRSMLSTPQEEFLRFYTYTQVA